MVEKHMPYSRNTNFDYQTNVKMNRKKKELAQRKGYKLQDLLDIMLDVVLDVDGLESHQILEQIEDVKEERRKLDLRYNALIDQLDKNKQEERSKVKSKLYDQLKERYMKNWDFEEEDTELIDEVALVLGLSRIDVQNKIINECNEEMQNE